MNLTKTEQKKYDDLASRFDTAQAELNDAITEYNDAVSNAYTAVEAPRNAVNALLEEMQQFAVEVAERLGETIDERSEKWQEGDVGQAWQEKRSAWENFCPSEAECESPDELEAFDNEAVIDEWNSLSES